MKEVKTLGRVEERKRRARGDPREEQGKTIGKVLAAFIALHSSQKMPVNSIRKNEFDVVETASERKEIQITGEKNHDSQRRDLSGPPHAAITKLRRCYRVRTTLG